MIILANQKGNDMNINVRTLTLLIKMIFLIVFAFKPNHAVSFEIGGWYHDPMSMAASRNLTGCPGDNDRLTWIANVESANDSMIKWCDEIGLTWVAVQFPDTASYAFSPLIGSNFKVLNTKWPDDGTYVIANRHFATPFVGTGHDGSSGHWRGWWFQFDSTEFDPTTESAELLPDDGPGHMWRVGPHCVGYTWNGWKDHVSEEYMPMHFRITCDAWIDSLEADEHPVIARVYWLFRNTSGRWCEMTGSWTRYPAMEITVDHFAGQYDWEEQMMEIEFVIDPSPGDSTFQVGTLDTTVFFWPNSTVPSYGNPYQFIESSTHTDGHKFGKGHTGRLEVIYEGYHGFRLQKIDVWDEGYHRLFESADSLSWQDSVAQVLLINTSEHPTTSEDG